MVDPVPYEPHPTFPGVDAGRCLGPVDETERIDARSFLSQYLKPRRPLIIRGGLGAMQVRSWTLEGLRHRIGTRRVAVTVRDGDSHKGSQKISVAELIDAIYNQTASSERYYLQVAAVKNFNPTLRRRDVDFPELEPEVDAFPWVAHEWFEEAIMWLGGDNTFSRYHYDPADGFLSLVRGRKELAMFHEDQTPFMYVRRGLLGATDHALFSRIDPNHAEEFPLLRRAEYRTASLGEGDVIYIPAGYWHAVRSYGHHLALTHFFYPPGWLATWLRPPMRAYALNYAVRAPMYAARNAWRAAGFAFRR